MTRRDRSAFLAKQANVRRGAVVLTALLGLGTALTSMPSRAADYPITGKQRSTAQQVAQDGIALSELAPNAPDSYTVKPGDTLWGISGVFLTSPWRWPELWGMNLDQIRNPHLIYPGQALYLDKANGRARLRMSQAASGGVTGDAKLSPRVRASSMAGGALPSIPFNLIEPFLTEAVIFDTDELLRAPRIVATQEGRVYLGRGDRAYVRGDLSAGSDYKVFREPRPLKDPTTGEILGYEGTYVGRAEYIRQGETRIDAKGNSEIVPATFTITEIRVEAGVGDRLAVMPQREFTNYAPHAPQSPIDGQVVSIYGDGLTAGQNQIVALNRGLVNGVERGHVLALLRDGDRVLDPTDSSRTTIKLPNERQGYLFVFRVFDRMSYALILSSQVPIQAGDRFSQP
jgi:hypothetical protein